MKPDFVCVDFLPFKNEEEFIEMSKTRKTEIEDIRTFAKYRGKIKDIAAYDGQEPLDGAEKAGEDMTEELPF